MAHERKRIPTAIKRTLVEEAGNRCINPGCSSARAHTHHIDQWAVYQTQDGRRMIAVCPTCHDAIHHGALALDDEILRRWKAEGKGPKKASLLFVEPGETPLIKVGQTAITGGGQGGLIVLAPSPQSRLSYRVEDGQIALVSCDIADSSGRPIIRLSDNRIRLVHPTSDFSFAEEVSTATGPALSSWS